jgi:hypothetical protein
MYLQTMGSENELGFAWARALKFGNLPKINLPKFPAPPRFVPPRLSPPRIPAFKAPVIKAPVIKAPVIKAPRLDLNKLSKEFLKPASNYVKTVSKGWKDVGKELQRGVKNIGKSFSNFSPPSQDSQFPEDKFNEEQFNEEQFYEPENMNFSQEPILTEEPTELSPQESEEMLGALTQGQAGILNTGLSVATSFIPGASMLQPAMSNFISQATKKPAKKPNPLQLLQQLQKRPAPRPAPRPAQRPPLLKATKREVSIQPEKKSDNTILIIGGIAIVALLMSKKKR